MAGQCVIVTILFGLVTYGLCSLTVNNNVVFHRTSEVTITRNKWLFSVVLDLMPFKNFIHKLSMDVHSADMVARSIAGRFDENDTKRRYYLNAIHGLQNEIYSLEDMREDLINDYSEIRDLDYHHDKRQKRSVLPIVGKALSFLFGTVSESELKTVRKSVKTLSDNQQEIIHVLEDSISVLNLSRVEISENRQAINNIAKNLVSIDAKVYNLTRALKLEIKELEHFLQLYLQLDLVIEELKSTTSKAFAYMAHLQLQLNMLSLGHLSPAIISPKFLRVLITDINAHLPKGLDLPIAPKGDIWKYYQSLTCATIIEGGQIIIIVSLPLLDQDNIYEIYEITSIPQPYGNKSINMVASHPIESRVLAIDKRRSRYLLLQESEITDCLSPHFDYCSVKSPVYPVNLSKYCIIALFLNNTVNIRNYCKVFIYFDTVLPQSTYIYDGTWALAAQEDLSFTVLCKNYSYNLKTRPPINIITLPMGCSANGDYLTLLPFYNLKTEFGIFEPHPELLKLHSTLKTFWTHFDDNLPNITREEIMPAMPEVKQIPMQSLMNRLSHLRASNREGTRSNLWLIVIICVSVALVVIAVIIIYLYRKKLFKLMTARRNQDIATIATAPPPEYRLVSTNEDAVDGVNARNRAATGTNIPAYRLAELINREDMR